MDSWQLKICFQKYKEGKEFREREQYVQKNGSWMQHKMLRDLHCSWAENKDGEVARDELDR